MDMSILSYFFVIVNPFGRVSVFYIKKVCKTQLFMIKCLICHDNQKAASDFNPLRLFFYQRNVGSSEIAGTYSSFSII